MPQGNDRICRIKCQTENLGGVLPLGLHVRHKPESHIPQSITRHYSLQSFAERIDLGLDLSRHFLGLFGRLSFPDRRLLLGRLCLRLHLLADLLHKIRRA